MELINWSKYDLAKAYLLAQRLGDDFIREMSLRLTDLDLVNRGVLLKSLKAKPVVQHLEVTRLQFSYEFYGAIWENGTSNAFGKGIQLEPRKWRSEAMEGLRADFDQQWADFYADTILKEIELESVQLHM